MTIFAAHILSLCQLRGMRQQNSSLAIELSVPLTWEAKTSHAPDGLLNGLESGFLLKDQVPALRRRRTAPAFYNISVQAQIPDYVAIGVFDQVYSINSGFDGNISIADAAFGLESRIKLLTAARGIDLDQNAGQTAPMHVAHFDLDGCSAADAEAIERALV